jgi:hypothetical protein
MEIRHATSHDEPPSSPGGLSFSSHAFGPDTARRRSFLQALLDGLLEYEARKGQVCHAPQPLPAA